MTEMLQEFCDWRGTPMRSDGQAGVIRGVKILGLQSRNGRTYLPEALAQAARLYEDTKVNVNHPKGSPLGPRDYQDRIGTIRNVAVRPGEGLFADFHFNPKHALAEQLLWDAEHAPENVGFSHNVEARTARRGEQVVVEAITRVQSVDLVADPATTRGLFESQAAAAIPGENLPASALETPPQSQAVSETRDPPQNAEIERLRAEVARLTLLEAAARKREKVRELLGEFHLPYPDGADPRAAAVTSRRFIESLLAAPDDAAMRTMVEERAALVRTLGSQQGKPLSRDQALVDGPASRLDTKTFVETITV